MHNEGYTPEELDELRELCREPIRTLNPDDHVRILLVGPHIHFAITDVFFGYYNALQSMDIDVSGFPTFQYKTMFADDMLMKFIHSMSTDPREGFTHRTNFISLKASGGNGGSSPVKASMFSAPP